MYLNKAIIAAVLGLSVASVSEAANVYMSGSTAMRGVIYNAMTTPNIVFNSAGSVFTGYGGSGSGDTYMAFSGVLKGGSGTTVIKCFWSGSEAGILDLVGGGSETFIADGSLNGLDNAGSPSVGTTGESKPVNLAMADTKQTYSQNPTPTLTHGTEVGIVTFKWVRNPGVWTGGNVTDQQIRSALGGAAPIGLFTGANDDTSYVYVAGRDTSSGTRANALGESGYGINTSVAQIVLSGGAMTDPDGGGTYETDSGQSSGGTLAKSLNFITTAGTGVDLTANGTGAGGTGNGFSVIAYLGYNDAKTALTAASNPATELTYDGVAFSTANVENGTYNFWGNEYLYEANNVNSTSNPAAQSTYTNLGSITSGVDTIFDDLSAIPLSQMHASRPGPNGDPSHN
jgi:hypothetical protein